MLINAYQLVKSIIQLYVKHTYVHRFIDICRLKRKTSFNKNYRNNNLWIPSISFHSLAN